MPTLRRSVSVSRIVLPFVRAHDDRHLYIRHKANTHVIKFAQAAYRAACSRLQVSTNVLIKYRAIKTHIPRGRRAPARASKRSRFQAHVSSRCRRGGDGYELRHVRRERHPRHKGIHPRQRERDDGRDEPASERQFRHGLHFLLRQSGELKGSVEIDAARIFQFVSRRECCCYRLDLTALENELDGAAYSHERSRQTKSA